MNPYTVCAFALASLGLIVVIRNLRPELASLASAVAGVLILVYAVSGLAPFIETLSGAMKSSGAESYFTLMLKALSIALCCQMSAEICRDCGENALASRVELAGKAGIILISLPVIMQLISLAKDMLK